MSDKRACTCEKVKLIQELPEGFSGIVTCAQCKDIAEISPKKSAPKESTPETLLADMRARSGMSYEAAVLTMLLRIEAAMIASKPIPATLESTESDPLKEQTQETEKNEDNKSSRPSGNRRG